jgi:D-tyrosyl-tRNA(Tyr) deacylase
VRVLLQVVDNASVTVDGQVIASAGRGLCAYVGIEGGDTPECAQRVAERIANVRLFPGEPGSKKLFDQSVTTVKGDVLLVSNFTLAGRLDSGRRPSWSAAASPAEALPVFNALAAALKDAGVSVITGEFGAEMIVSTSNHGPTNLLISETSP